jgi:long-chain fatty acid transport protein
VTYSHCEKIDLRAGLAYDNTPVAPADRSVRLPSGDRRVASLGVGYKINPTQSIDASYTYLDEEKAEVRQTAAGYNADFHNRASVYGLQFTQKF